MQVAASMLALQADGLQSNSCIGAAMTRHYMLFLFVSTYSSFSELMLTQEICRHYSSSFKDTSIMATGQFLLMYPSSSCSWIKKAFTNLLLLNQRCP